MKLFLQILKPYRRGPSLAASPHLPGKFNCLFLLLSLCFSTCMAWGQSQTHGQKLLLNASERAWMQQHPVVRWGVDPCWPPFSYYDRKGRICGIDVEMIALIGRRTGLNLQFVPTHTWSETLDKATSGEIDFVGGIARTDERENLLGLKFTETYCNFPTAIVTRKDLPFLTSINQLKSRKIALPRDYASTDELVALYPEMRMLLTDNEDQSMLMVAEGKADATVINLASASYIAHMRGLSNLKISGFSEIDFFLGLASRRDSPELRSILEKGLQTITPREKEFIYSDFIVLDTRREVDWKAWRNLAAYSALAGIMVAVVLFLWNRTVARETSRRKTAEAALMQSRDALQLRTQELDQRAGELQELNNKLAWANKDLEEFSYSVSHDLKAPLRRVQSFAEIVEIDAGNKLDADSRQSLNAIQSESQRMRQLIEALLAFAHVGHTQLRDGQVNMNALIHDVIKEMETQTRGREILWQIHPLPDTECDPQLIKQVLANLIGNALKFTRHRVPARIELGILPSKPEDGELVFYVKDNGAGFAKEQAGRLFGAFQRLHTQEEYEGTGIGLANVKRIIEKHGGRVWAEGELGKGAAFYFTLPRKRAE